MRMKTLRVFHHRGSVVKENTRLRVVPRHFADQLLIFKSFTSERLLVVPIQVGVQFKALGV